MLHPSCDRLVDLAAQSSSIAFSRPADPVADLEQNRQRDRFETRQVEVLELGEFLVRENGRLQLDQPACSGPGFSRLRSEPIVVSVDMMISSRMQSIGGLVTCAKSCLK